jgi:7-dehydrocholesterol reductase
MQAYIASLLLLLAIQTYGPAHGVSVSWVYDHMGELLSAMNVFSLLFCLFLLIKGLTFPSTADSGSTGNLVVDFYWWVRRGRGAFSSVRGGGRGPWGRPPVLLCDST